MISKQQENKIERDLIYKIKKETTAEQYNSSLEAVEAETRLSKIEILNAVTSTGINSSIIRSCVEENNPALFNKSIDDGAKLNNQALGALLRGRGLELESQLSIFEKIQVHLKDEISYGGPDDVKRIVQFIDEIESACTMKTKSPFAESISMRLPEFRREIGTKLGNKGYGIEEFKTFLEEVNQLPDRHSYLLMKSGSDLLSKWESAISEHSSNLDIDLSEEIVLVAEKVSQNSDSSVGNKFVSEIFGSISALVNTALSSTPKTSALQGDAEPLLSKEQGFKRE